MTAYYRPVPVSELRDPDGHVDDCVACSGLMQVNAHTGGKYPATLAEAEAIRAASGAPAQGGMNSQQLVSGTTKRYGFAAAIQFTPASILAAAQTGQGITLSGHLSNFPAGHRLRRFSPNYTGGHRVYVSIEDGPWWIDPLAPPASGYKGEAVTRAELAMFAQSGSGGTVAPLRIAERTLSCPTTLRATPSVFAAVTGSLPAGTVCTVVGTATNGWWSLNCGGPKSGRTWLHVSANGKSGYAPTGRFA